MFKQPLEAADIFLFGEFQDSVRRPWSLLKSSMKLSGRSRARRGHIREGINFRRKDRRGREYYGKSAFIEQL